MATLTVYGIVAPETPFAPTAIADAMAGSSTSPDRHPSTGRRSANSAVDEAVLPLCSAHAGAHLPPH